MCFPESDHGRYCHSHRTFSNHVTLTSCDTLFRINSNFPRYQGWLKLSEVVAFQNFRCRFNLADWKLPSNHICVCGRVGTIRLSEKYSLTQYLLRSCDDFWHTATPRPEISGIQQRMPGNFWAWLERSESRNTCGNDCLLYFLYIFVFTSIINSFFSFSCLNERTVTFSVDLGLICQDLKGWISQPDILPPLHKLTPFRTVGAVDSPPPLSSFRLTLSLNMAKIYNDHSWAFASIIRTAYRDCLSWFASTASRYLSSI